MKYVKLFEQFINESSLDSQYLRDMLSDLAEDAKRNGEKDLYKLYDYLETRINQSYPSGDVSREDIEDLMDDSRFRKMNLDVPNWIIDDLFEAKLSEETMKPGEESDVVIDDITLEDGREISSAEIVGAIVNSESEDELESYFFDKFGENAFKQGELAEIKQKWNEWYAEKKEEEADAEKEEDTGGEEEGGGGSADDVLADL